MSTPDSPQATPLFSPYARELAAAIGAIANTTEWDLPSWQALIARLDALAVPVKQLTIGQMLAAIHATGGQLKGEADA